MLKQIPSYEHLSKLLLLAFLLAVAWWNNDSKPTKFNPNFERERLGLLEQRANRPNQPLVITPIEIASDMGLLTCTKQGKTLFFFDSKIEKGKIILNSKVYLLNEGLITAKAGINIFSGSGVRIVTTIPSGGRMKDNDECSYVTFPYMIIAVGRDSTVLKEVEIQDCPYIIKGPGAR